MKKFLFLLILGATACGGSLSDDQRKRIRESMEQGEIKKVTDAELTEAGFELGRSIVRDLQAADEKFESRAIEDSVEGIYDAEIFSLQPGDSMLKEIEKQIVEAYLAGNSIDLPDNLQKVGNDSLLYTKPIMQEQPDGSVKFVKAVGIRLSKKQVILSLKD